VNTMYEILFQPFNVSHVYEIKGYLTGILQAILLVVNFSKVNVSSNLSSDGDASQTDKRRCRMLLVEQFL
jgi:hypothetical protein